MQILLFLSFGEKTTLLSIALIFIVYYGYKKKNVLLLVFGFMTVNLFAFIVYLLLYDYQLLSVANYRMAFIPARIGYNYYDFFSSGNPFLSFSETIFGRLLGMTKTYGITFAYYITGGRGMANTGVVADAYANGGIVACFVFAIVLGIVLVIYDRIVKSNIYRSVFVGSLGYSCINMMDNGLLTSLLTNGILLTLVLGILVNDRENPIGKKIS